MAGLHHLLRGSPPALRPAPPLPPLLRPCVPRPLPGAMAGVLPGWKEEAHLPRLQAALRRRPLAGPPLLPVHRRVPNPGPLTLTRYLRGCQSRGARRRGRPAGVGGGVPRQGARGAARRDQEAQRRVVRWRVQAATVEALREVVRKEKECVQRLLNAKTEEKSFALAKELAARNRGWPDRGVKGYFRVSCNGKTSRND